MVLSLNCHKKSKAIPRYGGRQEDTDDGGVQDEDRLW